MGLRSAWETFSDYYNLQDDPGDFVFGTFMTTVIGGLIGFGGSMIALSSAEDDATQGQAVAVAHVASYKRDFSVIQALKTNSKNLEAEMGAALATESAVSLPEAERAKAGATYKSLMSSWTSQQDQATKMTTNLYTRLILDDKISEAQFRDLKHDAKDTLKVELPDSSPVKTRECQIEFAKVSLPDDQKAAQVAACSVEKKDFSLFGFPIGVVGGIGSLFLIAPFMSAASTRRLREKLDAEDKKVNIEITLKPKK